MFIRSNHYGIKFLSNPLQLEPCNVIFKVISLIMSRWYEKWNTIVIAINFCNAKKQVHWLIISSHYERKCRSTPLQLDPYNVMVKVISDIMAHWWDLWNGIVISINISNGKKMIRPLRSIISNHYLIKCLQCKESNLCIDDDHKQSTWNKMC